VHFVHNDLGSVCRNAVHPYRSAVTSSKSDSQKSHGSASSQGTGPHLRSAGSVRPNQCNHRFSVRVIPCLWLGDHLISCCILDVHCADTQKMEAMMQTPKARFAFALLVPALLALSISEAAAQKSGNAAAAARAECFRQANEAATNVNLANPSATAERNSRGVAVYRECARRSGIRP
jgi:hypothetical protein